MSKTQLQTNNAKLEALITTLQGKAAGGGGSSSGSGFTYEDKPCFTYTVDSVGGASYGFSQNSAGYWESENKGVKSTYAICRVNFIVTATCDITFDVINYAESNYDYGLMGNLDSALKLSIDPDGTVKQNFKTTHSASVVNVTYADVPTGSHFIDIKYLKDSSTNSRNDSFQFKVQAAPTYQTLSAESMAMIRAEDADLVAGNIKSGVDIFGVTGTYTGGGATLETCTVTVTGCEAVYYTSVENGAIVAKASTGANATATHNIIVCKNSMVVCALLQGAAIIVTGGELNASYLTYYCACEVTSDNASITATNQGGSID